MESVPKNLQCGDILPSDLDESKRKKLSSRKSSSRGVQHLTARRILCSRLACAMCRVVSDAT